LGWSDKQVNQQDHVSCSREQSRGYQFVIGHPQLR
jgi:hypothetical protein